ncbi:hypothetical protein DPMN_001056 [Dreissena polymorpha]|uniref:Uncharacterized protein n=1 Tax=Dreissena polymorpha TaxID=45954 RepID=A0A9D4MKR1_DREPO|nr:hypothetical protein DPMN_001056 [Dreissena polymorpha]
MRCSCIVLDVSFQSYYLSWAKLGFMPSESVCQSSSSSSSSSSAAAASSPPPPELC